MAIKCFIVGGAVRDILMMRQPKDVDFVLTGMTAADVEKLVEAGFEQVGADFPVFLHPLTGDEFALARTERKVGHGYVGFEVFTSPELTIEDDLRRRDLTINSMAIEIPFDINNPTSNRRVTPSSHEWFHNDRRNVQFGELIDPFGGLRDIENRVLRHTSEAFVEDPVRVLRIARFAARMEDFMIADETKQLMIHMAVNGELNHLVPERVFKEVEKAASEKNFARFFEELPIDCQSAIFNANVMAVANSHAFFKTTMSDVDKLQTARQKIVFAFLWVSGIIEAMNPPQDILHIRKALNDNQISRVSGTPSELDGCLTAIRKFGFLNKCNDEKMLDVLAILSMLNINAAEFVADIIHEARKVDIESALKASKEKPSFELVNKIIIDKITSRIFK